MFTCLLLEACTSYHVWPVHPLDHLADLSSHYVLVCYTTLHPANRSVNTTGVKYTDWKTWVMSVTNYNHGHTWSMMLPRFLTNLLRYSNQVNITRRSLGQYCQVWINEVKITSRESRSYGLNEMKD